MSRSLNVVVALTSLVAAVSACAPAWAQTTDAQTSVQGSGGDNLSSKLSKSGGVITPKEGIDPAIKAPAPAPHPNSTPVIPPSATGGDSAK